MLDFIWESLLAWLQTIILSCLDLINLDMLYAFSPQMITMEKYFPWLTETWDIIQESAFAMIVFLCIFKMFQNSFLVFTKNYEHPGILIIRSVFAFAVITALPSSVKYLFDFADIAYWEVMQRGFSNNLSADAGSDEITIVGDNMFTSICGSIGSSIISVASDFGERDLTAEDVADLAMAAVAPVSMADNLAAALVSLVLTIAIAWNYFKLVLEIAERYIVLGIMYYTMPLAAVPLVSRETSAITKSWLRMLVSELMILVLNVWFVAAFRMAMRTSGPTTAVTIHGQSVHGGLLWSFIAIAFLKTAQRIDSYIATLGLTTAQLGTGVAGTLSAAALSTAGMFRMGRRGSSGSGAGVFGSGKGAFGKGVFAGMSPNAQKAANTMAKAGKQNSTLSSVPGMKEMSPAEAMAAVKQTGVKLEGQAAAEYVQKMAPGLNGKEITSATADKHGFEARYKDANGNDATLSFGEQRPDGISKNVRIGDTEGFLQDNGTPFSDMEINGGDTLFDDFAAQHLNGSDNFIAQSGKVTPKDLADSTIHADDDGNGFTIRDADGYELAHVTPFNERNADSLTPNTVIGEGSDGLYRADFNPEAKMPLPEGYSYAGERFVNDEGVQISPSGPDSANGHWQDSFYSANDDKYLSRGEINQVVRENTLSNSDYAGSIQYSTKDGFVDNSGNPVDISKAGWTPSRTGEEGVYENKFTGGVASGEQIAEHMANPSYAAQSYGGLNGEKETYFDNHCKVPLSAEQLESAPQYGETISDRGDYYNPDTGGFGSPVNTTKNNFGDSVEALMDKDYSFSGDVGAKVAKAYMPNLKDSDAEILNAYMEKDSITVDIADANKNPLGPTSNTPFIREQYMRKLPETKTSGTYETVDSSGNSAWTRTYRGESKGSNSNNSRDSSGYGGGGGNRSDNSGNRRPDNQSNSGRDNSGNGNGKKSSQNKNQNNRPYSDKRKPVNKK